MRVMSNSMARLAAVSTLAAIGLLPAGCGEPPEPPAAGESRTWLAGSTQDQLDQLAGHFAGFSAAMVEVGYRYNELFFAGEEANWPLAEYHLEHMVEAIERGIERRPARGPSSQPFLDDDAPALMEAIDARDLDLFRERFLRLTAGCNVCHVREDVAFIRIREPERRLLPWDTPGS